MENDKFLKKYLRQAINEELSINTEVMAKTNELAQQIKSFINNNKNVETTPVAIGIKRKYFNFYTDFKGREIHVIVYCFDFSNEELYEKEKANIDCDYAQTITDGNKYNILKIFCYSISGKLSTTFFDSLQHEIEHYFQNINGDKRLETFDDVYAIAGNNLFNKDNKALMYISNIIYYSYDYEQDGYVNGLYAELMKMPLETPRWEDISKSSAFIGYKMLTKSLNTINKNKNKSKVIQSAQAFNMPVDKILEIGTKAQKRFIQKIGRVLIKVQQDKQLQEGTRTLIGKHGELGFFVD